MKDFLKILFFLNIFFIFSALNVYADDITVIIDGETQSYSVSPVVENNRIMVPLRETFEAFGAQVFWDAEANEATAVKENKTVKLAFGSDTLIVNGSEVKMDCAAIEINNRILIPVRFAAEAFGYTVSWDSNTFTVKIIGYPDYECYGIEGEKVPLYDSVIPAAERITEKLEACEEGSYAYSTTYDDVTEYIMTLQNDYGYSYYTTNFYENDRVCYIYRNVQTGGVVQITASNTAPYGYTVIITPTVYGQTTENNSEPSLEDKGNKPDLSDDYEESAEYYDNTQNTLPTYTYITGIQLSEKVESDESVIYKYKDSFFGMSQYKMAITMFCGYSEYKTEIDFGTLTTYYVNGDTVIGIVNSMFTDEVWIIIPKE